MSENPTSAPHAGRAGEPATDDPGAYLATTWYLDFDEPSVAAYADEKAGGGTDAVEKAIKLYYAVRDDIRYDPYAMFLRADTFKASYVLNAGRGFCIQKGSLLAAVARRAGIPARLGFADVRNHLATRRLLDLLETDLFIFHGYVEMYLDGKWVKSTPAFNLGLCEKFGVLPLEFDGRTDSLFHPFDAEGRKHMEYVDDRGAYADVPFEEIEVEFGALYPKYFALHGSGGDFYAEAEAERKPDA
ncbi:MAG: transglutaminase-like domain-containing protein [Alphaproteobacteria bacterium]